MSIYEKYYIDFDKIKEKVLEGFVAIYGEKHRELIKERLDSIYINTYITVEDLKRYINNSLKDKAGRLTINLLEENGFELNSEQREAILNNYVFNLNDEMKEFLKMFFKDYIYTDTRYSGIMVAFDEEKYENSTDRKRHEIEEERVEILNSMGAQVTIENYKEIIASGEIDDILTKIEQLITRIKRMDKEYLEFEATFSNELAEIDRCEGLIEDLKKENNFEYLKAISDLLPPEEQKKIYEAMQESWFDYRSEYFVYSIESEPLIEYFSTYANERLENGESWEKDEIKRKRIEFFKYKGIDLGDNYDLYINNPEVINIIPKSDLADRIVEIRKKFSKKFSNEVIEQTGSYLENKKRLEELGLLIQDEYCPEFVQEGVICVCQNVVNNDGNLQSQAVIHIPIFNIPRGCYDVFLIHEIGHAIELELLGIIKNEAKHKTGFEYIVAEVGIEEEYKSNPEKREFEIISETIHQQLAIEVTQYLHSQGQYLIDNPESSKTVHSSSYEHNYNMVREFFERYRQDIIDARMSDEGFKKLITKIPYQNIKQLNELVREYSILPHNKIIFAIQENRDIPEIEMLEDLRNRMKKLMEEFEKVPPTEALESTIETTKKVTKFNQMYDVIGRIECKATISKEEVYKEGETKE